MLHAFFWVIPRRLNFICRRFGTLCSIFVGRYACVEWTRLEKCWFINWKPHPSPVINQHFSNLVHSAHAYLPMKMEQSVPKRRHINFRRRGITQKKAYNRFNFVSNSSNTLASLYTTFDPYRIYQKWIIKKCNVTAGIVWLKCRNFVSNV
jgi:hypothetical protein